MCAVVVVVVCIANCVDMRQTSFHECHIHFLIGSTRTTKNKCSVVMMEYGPCISFTSVSLSACDVAVRFQQCMRWREIFPAMEANTLFNAYGKSTATANNRIRKIKLGAVSVATADVVVVVAVAASQAALILCANVSWHARIQTLTKHVIISNSYYSSIDDGWNCFAEVRTKKKKKNSSSLILHPTAIAVFSLDQTKIFLN